jgi:hypothetical protein
MKNVIMKFKDAPIGARFHFIGDDAPKDIYVKIHAYDSGLVVKWNGNISHLSVLLFLWVMLKPRMLMFINNTMKFFMTIILICKIIVISLHR